MISAAAFPLKFTIPKNVFIFYCGGKICNIEKEVSLCEAFSDSSAYNAKNCASYIHIPAFLSQSSSLWHLQETQQMCN